MSMPVLVQVYDEMRRLAIAGSAVAPGDFRLKKLVAPLEHSGAKAPVFARVAQAAQAVVDSDERSASAALLELTTLVNAILYTQGETGLAGDLAPLETTDLGGHATQASARVLKPLLEALSTTGSGRIELVRDAVEHGTFTDLRLVRPTVDALDDPYPEIADLIARRVLPLYGRAIVPMLRSKLDLAGRGGHVHRLRLMHALDPAGSRDVVQKALAEGSKEIRVAAVECLGTSGDDLALLLEHARSKAKDVRAAALRALSSADVASADAIATLKNAITGPDLDLFADRVAGSASPEIQAYVLAQAEAQLDAVFAAKEKKEQGEAVARMQRLVACLERRTDASAEAFLLKCFDRAAALAKVKSEPSGTDLSDAIAHVLSRGTPTMKARLVAAHASLAGGSLAPALYAARETMSPAAFFETFAGRLNPGGRAKSDALAGVLTAGDDEVRARYRPWMRLGQHAREGPVEQPLPPLDPRWLDVAVEGGVVDLVCALARPGHAAANAFLAAHFATRKYPNDGLNVLQTIVRVRHPDATAVVIASLKKHAKDALHRYYLRYWYAPLIADLPRSAAVDFEALLPTLPETMADGLLDAIATLKEKSEDA